MRRDSPTYLRKCAEVTILGFVGPLNAVVNTWAVARDLGGNAVLSNQLGHPHGPDGLPRGQPS